MSFIGSNLFKLVSKMQKSGADSTNSAEIITLAMQLMKAGISLTHSGLLVLQS